MTDGNTLRTDNRLFVALDPPPAMRLRLDGAARELAADSGGRRVPAEGLHVTLAFLGRVAPEDGPELLARLRRTLPGHVPRVRLGDAVGRPSAGRARLAAVALDDLDGALTDLAARVADACAGHGDAPGGARPFWPHVTILRFGRPTAVRRFPSTRHEHVFDITRASLYDSHITPGRPPRYEALMEVRLDGSYAERSPSHG